MSRIHAKTSRLASAYTDHAPGSQRDKAHGRKVQERIRAMASPLMLLASGPSGIYVAGTLEKAFGSGWTSGPYSHCAQCG